MSANVVDNMADKMLGLAKRNFLADGFVHNIVLVITGDGKISHLRMDDYPRALQPLMVQIAANSSDASLVIHISEAWMATEIAGKEIGLPPSEREDKQEVILVHVRSRWGTQAYRSTQIDRQPQGVQFVKPNSIFDGMEGTYQSRLLDHAFDPIAVKGRAAS